MERKERAEKRTRQRVMKVRMYMRALEDRLLKPIIKDLKVRIVAPDIR